VRSWAIKVIVNRRFFLINYIIILYYGNQARNNYDILKFYSMEQEITHYSHRKLHVGQINVRESARSTK
jgi:hypothetical protein